MFNRLERRFFPWLIAHGLEFWHYYSAALLALLGLHWLQSQIPDLAKGLGERVLSSNLSGIELSEFFLLALGILIFRTLSRLLFFYPARVQQKNLRVELMQKLEASFPENYKDRSDGDLFQSLISDFNRIRGFVGFALLQVGNIIIAGVVFIPKIQEANSEFLIAFTPIVFCMVFFSILIFLFQPFMRKEMDQYADLQNYVIESYEAKKTIKNFHSEKSFYDLFNFYSKRELKTFFISSLGRVLSFPMIKMGVAFSLIWAALIVEEKGMSATELIFFSGFLFLIIEPLMSLSWIGIVMSQGYAAWSRIKELLADLKLDRHQDWVNQSLDHGQVLVPFWEKVVRLKLTPGSWHILVGETGAGKSYLLERLSDYFSHQKVSYSFIQQEPYLYNTTIGENIFLNLPQTEQKMQLAQEFIKLFGLDVLAPSLEEVLSLEVGENGKQISGGQAKRVALMRSLISDVDYIIWDDPFSSVDLIMEKEIIEKLKERAEFAKKTFIFSGHRLSTVKNCDFVFYVDKKENNLSQENVKDAFKKGHRVFEFFEKQMV